jgi:hypothetical protein
MQLTYKFRLRGRSAAELSRQMRAINVALNYGNAMHKAIELDSIKGGGRV